MVRYANMAGLAMRLEPDLHNVLFNSQKTNAFSRQILFIYSVFIQHSWILVAHRTLLITIACQDNSQCHLGLY